LKFQDQISPEFDVGCDIFHSPRAVN